MTGYGYSVGYGPTTYADPDPTPDPDPDPDPTLVTGSDPARGDTIGGSGPGQRIRNLGRWIWRGSEVDPGWVRPLLLILLGATAGLYLWGLGNSGWANSYYSAAAQAGSADWKAYFFGSFDAANFITVDKPPASLWVMSLSARIFGVNPWSILVPQALAGVAAVGLLYLTIRRWFSPAAALIAGAVFALTPVAVLMFRYNNPDALLVLLLVAAAYFLTRAIDSGKTSWLLLVGALIGMAFLAKMMQAYLVVPGFALAYLLAGPPRLGRRLLQLFYAGVAMLVASAWWVAIVELIPASSRPYIGGSQNNSILNLIFGYNGIGRLNGNEAGSVGGIGPGGAGAMGGGAIGGGAGSGRWGATGWSRLFADEMGTQISWLLPAALILLVAMVVLAGTAPRTDRLRAAAMVWGGWLLVTGLVFSFAQGIIHGYYTVALAPAIAAIIGIGGVELWRCRESAVARLTMTAAVGITGLWAFVLLDRTPAWVPWLKYLVFMSAVITAVLVLFWQWLGTRVIVCVGLAIGSVALAAPISYAVVTAASVHAGGIVSAGPVGAAGLGGSGGQGVRGGFGPGLPGGLRGGPFGQGAGQGPGGAGPGGGQGPGGWQLPGNGQAPGDGNALGLGNVPGGGPPRSSRAGGLLNGSQPSAQLTRMLEQDADSYTWIVATVGANQAAGYQLATDRPVMAIGGFNGTDPAPSLAEFQQYVAAGRIHFFIAGGGPAGSNNAGAAGAAGADGTGTGGNLAGTGGAGNPGGKFGSGLSGTGVSAQISQWVQANFKGTVIDGITVYDLAEDLPANL